MQQYFQAIAKLKATKTIDALIIDITFFEVLNTQCEISPNIRVTYLTDAYK